MEVFITETNMNQDKDNMPLDTPKALETPDTVNKVDKKPAIWRGILASFLIFILVQLVGSFIMLGLKKTIPNMPVIANGLISTYVAYILIVFLYMYSDKDGWSWIRKIPERLHINKVNWKRVIILLWMAFMLYIATSLAQELLLHIFPTTNLGNETTDMITSKKLGWLTPIITYLIPLVIAPVFEEVIFRGILGRLFGALDGKNRVIYIIVESLAFALMHLQLTGSTFSMLSAVLMPMISGLAFGILYIKRKNLSETIIVHSGYNMITILLRLFLA